MIVDQSHLVLPNWHVPARIRVVSTTRLSGVSRGIYASNNLGYSVGDEVASVERNWRVLQHSLDYDFLAKVKQVHGRTVVSAAEAMKGECQADAIWSDSPGVACAIVTADCLPVVFVNQAADRVAVAHCGWRGLADGIISETLKCFDDPSQVYVWVGPGISQTNYQVGSLVYDSFSSYSQCFKSVGDDQWQCNLAAIAKKQLSDLGVSSIYFADRCTYQEEDLFYSYRRDGKTGRIATLAWLAWE